MRTRCGRILKWLSVLIVALSVFAAFLMVVGSLRLRSELNALAGAGRPLQAAQIIPPPLDDADNGAPLVAAAQNLLVAERVGTNSAGEFLDAAWEREKNGVVDKASQKNLVTFVRSDSAARIWDLLEQATRRRACRFPVAWDQGPATLMPHLGKMRSLSRALAAKALAEAREGQGDEAWKTLGMGLSIADILRDEPAIISQLVRVGQLGLAMDAIRRASVIAPPTEAQALAVGRQIAVFDIVPGAMKGLDGEHLLMFGWVRQRPLAETLRATTSPAAGTQQSNNTGWMLAGILWRPVRDMDYAAYLRVMQRYWQVEKESAREWVLTAEALPEPSVPWYCLVTRILTPAVGAFWGHMAGTQSNLAVTRAGLLLQMHNARHGVYPDTLDGLDPDLKAVTPPDPLTGRPLLYRRDGRGFILYSVGRNLKDDGGSDTRMTKESSIPLDVVWRMPGR